MINLLIVGDNKVEAYNLKNLITRYKPEWNIYIVSESQSAKLIYENHRIDIFILEACLSEYNQGGIRIAESLRQTIAYANSPIIFISESNDIETLDYAINSIHCFSYIFPPFPPSQIYRALDDICQKYNFHTSEELTIKNIDSIYIPIKTDSIVYIESSNHLITFYTTDGEIYCGRKSLSYILSLLDSRFVQSHKKYIVNISYIQNYDKTNRMITIHGKHLPIGRAFKSNLDNNLY